MKWWETALFAVAAVVGLFLIPFVWARDQWAARHRPSDQNTVFESSRQAEGGEVKRPRIT